MSQGLEDAKKLRLERLPTQQGKRTEVFAVDSSVTGVGELVQGVFAPPIHGSRIELSMVAALQAHSEALMERPGRMDFHTVIICTGGAGFHEVDFTPVSVEPGRVIHTRPGQVRRWHFAQHYEADVLMFVDGAAHLAAHRWPIGPHWIDLTDKDQVSSAEALAILRHEQTADRTPASRDRAMTGVLQLVIVRLGLDVQSESDHSSLPQPYIELMEQLETDGGWSRSVTDRAMRLGYSQRTLSRACKTATGRTAKEVVDDRITIEAKRLLINEHTTVERVAQELSFTEPGNFTRFFHRMTGENPDAWRARHTAGHKYASGPDVLGRPTHSPTSTDTTGRSHDSGPRS